MLIRGICDIALNHHHTCTLQFATGMYSKDGEFVDLASECDLNGQVEVWLNRLLKVQQQTVLHEMDQAVVTYEEKPRDQWIFDFPAQVSYMIVVVHKWRSNFFL